MKKIRRFKDLKGITLIALVVTIIVMLILAGVSVNLTLGSNGIFKRAKIAEQEYLNAEASEEEKIRELEERLAEMNKNLPENTADTEAGTPVKIPKEWVTITSAYVSDTDGREVSSLKKVASTSVVAIADGQGKTVPVPQDFVYVGGTVDSGVVISDNKADKDKYKGQEFVPNGIESIKDGTGAITGISRTLQGNQFVWVPVTGEYEKYDFGETYRKAIYNTDLSSIETKMIKKYKGFYVGRYESGLASTITEATTTKNNGTSDEPYDVIGKPQIKAGIVPWNFISYTNSKKNADNMYNTQYVQSGLITGAMWDNMLKFMAGSYENATLTTACSWGNYANTTPTIQLGKYAYGYNSSGWKMDKYGDWMETIDRNNLIKKPEGTVNGRAYIWTTGASDECQKKNIYDAAGNLWEWTEESVSSLIDTTVAARTDYRTDRGGSGVNSYSMVPVSWRNYRPVNRNEFNVGFRVALYIM